MQTYAKYSSWLCLWFNALSAAPNCCHHCLTVAWLLLDCCYRIPSHQSQKSQAQKSSPSLHGFADSRFFSESLVYSLLENSFLFGGPCIYRLPWILHDSSESISFYLFLFQWLSHCTNVFVSVNAFNMHSTLHIFSSSEILDPTVGEFWDATTEICYS